MRKGVCVSKDDGLNFAVLKRYAQSRETAAGSKYEEKDATGVKDSLIKKTQNALPEFRKLPGYVAWNQYLGYEKDPVLDLLPRYQKLESSSMRSMARAYHGPDGQGRRGTVPAAGAGRYDFSHRSKRWAILEK
jgi:hypothetical protein